jgi:multidrug resistance efflux pump
VLEQACRVPTRRWPKPRLLRRGAEGFKRRAVEELSKTGCRSRAQESLNEASDRVRRTEIRSPIDGIVKNMRFHTIGGVVRPGSC